jgi:hypothetical protein
MFQNLALPGNQYSGMFGSPQSGGGQGAVQNDLFAGGATDPWGNLSGSLGGGQSPSYGGVASPGGSGGGGVPVFFPGGGQGGSGGSSSQNPYQVPSQSLPFNSYSGYGSQNSPFTWPSIGGTHAVPPQYAGLAGSFANMLGGQVGQGVSPYNLSVPLPTGGSTQPGQLTAGENPLLQQLQGYFSGQQSNAPGSNTLSTIANQGISALPEWQSMLAAMQQNIQQGQSNLAEQFAGLGGVAGTGFGNAMQQYNTQTALGENSLLGQLQQQNILQGQIPVAEGLQSQGQNLANTLQSLNQQAIQNQYGEFVRTSPQYNPLISNMQSMASIYPPTVTSGSGVGTLGGLLSGAGQGAGSILGALGDAGLL